MKLRLLLVGTFAGALGVILGITANANSASISSPAEEARAALPESAKVQVNKQGQKFGSAVDAADPLEEPDLILVVATNGVEGYVWEKELNLPPGTASESARSDSSKPRTLTVFKSDGTTIVGEFVVNGALVPSKEG